jgi:hypothetical protein
MSCRAAIAWALMVQLVRSGGAGTTRLTEVRNGTCLIFSARPRQGVLIEGVTGLQPAVRLPPLTTARHPWPFRIPCSVDRQRLVKRLGLLSAPDRARAVTPEQQIQVIAAYLSACNACNGDEMLRFLHPNGVFRNHGFFFGWQQRDGDHG